MFEIKSEPVSFLVYLKPQCTGGHLWIKVGQVPSQSATRPLPPAWCKSRHEVRWSPLLQYHLLQQSHKHQEALLRVGKTGNFWQSLYEQKWKPSASQPSCSFEEMHLYCGRAEADKDGTGQAEHHQSRTAWELPPCLSNNRECDRMPTTRGWNNKYQQHPYCCSKYSSVCSHQYFGGCCLLPPQVQPLPVVAGRCLLQVSHRTKS